MTTSSPILITDITSGFKTWYIFIIISFGIIIVIIAGYCLRQNRANTRLINIAKNKIFFSSPLKDIDELRKIFGQELNSDLLRVNFIDKYGQGVSANVYKGKI